MLETGKYNESDQDLRTPLNIINISIRPAGQLSYCTVYKELTRLKISSVYEIVFLIHAKLE